MISRLVAGLAIVVSLVCAGEAFAVTIPATDLDTWLTGGSVAGPLTDDFDNALAPPATSGSLENEVFLNGTAYTYTHEVTPTVNNNLLFTTSVPIAGFTGIAGYSFSQSGGAGGAGSALDFEIVEVDGFLGWVANLPEAGWDSGEAITFFYVSNNRPGMGEYNLTSFTSFGTAQSFAPVPEPGSIALLGSGLVGLYAAVRRRRQRQS